MGCGPQNATWIVHCTCNFRLTDERCVQPTALFFFFLIAPTSTIELHDNSQTEGHLAINKSFSTIQSRAKKKHMMWRNGVDYEICVQPESLGNIILIHDTQED